MADDLDIYRDGIRRFRSGGIAVARTATGPRLGACTLRQPGDRLMMIIISLILLFLVFWATHCAEGRRQQAAAARPAGDSGAGRSQPQA